MKPKDGKAIKPVAPAEPDPAEDADIADPGKMAEIKAEQEENKEGKYGSEQVKPYKPPEEDEAEAEEKTWIEIKLVDSQDNPFPSEKYEIILPDDSVATGTLDGDGFARLEGIVPGTCRITFPDRDKDVWEGI